MSHWAKKTTITDPQRAVIPIMPYKVPRDLIKLLVSALALLGERLTAEMQLKTDSTHLSQQEISFPAGFGQRKLTQLGLSAASSMAETNTRLESRRHQM